MALMLSVNIPVSQPKSKAEPLAKEPLAKEGPRPAPLNAVPQAPPRRLHQADTFVSAPSAPKGRAPTNVAAENQAALGWNGDASLVKQDSPTGCGTANLAQICDAACGPAQSPKQHQQHVESNAAEINNSAALKDRVRINLKDGATPDEMAALLGKQGQMVLRSFDTFEVDYVNGALQQGQLGLTLLDSNVLRNAMLPPEKRTNEPGALHWITVDGIDHRGTADFSDDLYRVKDPIHGAYWISEGVLKAAVAQARARTGSGGVLIIENDRTATTKGAREALALQNLNYTAVVGKGNGIGSKPTSVLEPS